MKNILENLEIICYNKNIDFARLCFLNLRFENDVKMYGTQTWLNRLMNMKMFENDVKMYGS